MFYFEVKITLYPGLKSLSVQLGAAPLRTWRQCPGWGVGQRRECCKYWEHECEREQYVGGMTAHTS